MSHNRPNAYDSRMLGRTLIALLLLPSVCYAWGGEARSKVTALHAVAKHLADESPYVSETARTCWGDGAVRCPA